MNQWFWDDLMPGWRQSDLPATLIGVGSLLTTNLDLPTGRKIIVGAGAGYGTPPKLTPPGDWDVRFVRGPKTARALGLDPSFGLTDPAAFVPRLPRFAGHQPKGRRPLFVPTATATSTRITTGRRSPAWRGSITCRRAAMP